MTTIRDEMAEVLRDLISWHHIVNDDNGGVRGDVYRAKAALARHDAKPETCPRCEAMAAQGRDILAAQTAREAERTLLLALLRAKRNLARLHDENGDCLAAPLQEALDAISQEEAAFQACAGIETESDSCASSGFLTAAEIAARLRVSRSTITRLCQQGRIPHIRIGGSLRFDWALVSDAVECDSRSPDRVRGL